MQHLHLVSASISTLTLLTLACGGVKPRAIDDGPSASSGANFHSDGPIHSTGGWRQSVYFYIAAGTPESIEEAVLAAAHSWNDAVGADLMVYEGRTDATKQVDLYNTLADNQTVVYYDKQWKKHTGKSEGVLATTTWENNEADARFIDRGDVILNAENFYFQDATSDAEDPAEIYDIADTESVLLHEFGHLLGLDHTDEEMDAESIMHPKTFVGLGIYNRELSGGDIQRIRSIYGKNNPNFAKN